MFLIFDFSGVVLENLVIHKTGSRFNNEGVSISKDLYPITDNSVQDLLLKYFLVPFRNDIYYHFSHTTEIQLNEVYTFVKRIFDNKDSFYDQSVNILKHLYEQSTHPNIKSGEFYMAYLANCIIDGEYSSAIGIFKSENKDIYLKVNEKNSKFELLYDKGININKLDKGCLIFNTNSDSGYKVSIVDSSNSNEAIYWKNNFLNLTEIQNDNFITKNYLKLCKEFSKSIYKNELNKDSKEQSTFLNNTINYFNEHDVFNSEEFENEILKESSSIDLFNSFIESYDKSNGTSLSQPFSISKPMLKTMKKQLNKIIKLDSEVEIKLINSNGKDSNLIEKGFDKEKGMNYYKIFFNTES